MKLPNLFLMARSAWEANDRATGFRMLNEFAAAQLSQPAFIASDFILEGRGTSDFFHALQKLTGDDRYLLCPFADVFVAIWHAFPHQPAIDLLRGRSFGGSARPGQDAAALDVGPIVAALRAAAEAGWLSGDPAEIPNGGRPVLTLQTVDEIDPAHWGVLRTALLSELPAAYGRCPVDAWQRLALAMPEQCLARFLHEMFIVYSRTVSAAELRWAVVAGEFPSYARAVRDSLGAVLAPARRRDAQWYTSVVRLDAGLLDVGDGRQWLTELSRALSSGSFDALSQAGTNDQSDHR